MNTSVLALLSDGNYEEDDGLEYGLNDLGGGENDFGDSENTFLSVENSFVRPSTGSRNSIPAGPYPFSSMKNKASTTFLLDALCSSDAFADGGEYEYFSQAALEKVTSGNLWAGSAHWKKTEKIRSKRAKQSIEHPKEVKKKPPKERIFLDLTVSSFPSVDVLLEKEKPKKARSDPLQLTQASLKKQKKIKNLLPPDAGIYIGQLSRLFMRPNDTLRSSTKEKIVGFHDEEFNMMYDDGGGESYCEEGDDGQGFALASETDGNFVDADDFEVKNIEGVRKVEKIQVGYARVAKKVDVRRLKKDLWTEVEEKISSGQVEQTQGTENIASNETWGKTMEISVPDEVPSMHHVSFQETVQELEMSQNQSEVTVPFYFICILHLANEKCLKLDSVEQSLHDFVISRDDGFKPTVDSMKKDTKEMIQPLFAERIKRSNNIHSYQEEAGSSSEEDDDNVEIE